MGWWWFGRCSGSGEGEAGGGESLVARQLLEGLVQLLRDRLVLLLLVHQLVCKLHQSNATQYPNSSLVRNFMRFAKIQQIDRI